MARPVYSTLFIAVAAMAPDAGYTVPEGFTAVVRDVSILFDGTTPTDTACGVYDASTGTYYAYSLMVSNQQYFHWVGHQVQPQGSTFSVIGFGPTEILARVSGYLLTNDS